MARPLFSASFKAGPATNSVALIATPMDEDSKAQICHSFHMLRKGCLRARLAVLGARDAIRTQSHPPLSSADARMSRSTFLARPLKPSLKALPPRLLEVLGELVSGPEDGMLRGLTGFGAWDGGSLGPCFFLC